MKEIKEMYPSWGDDHGVRLGNVKISDLHDFTLSEWLENVEEMNNIMKKYWTTILNFLNYLFYH